MHCKRCGLCCILGCCTMGTEDPETDICKHLIINTDLTTTCSLLLHKTVTPLQIGISKGCIIRTFSNGPEIFGEQEAIEFKKGQLKRYQNEYRKRESTQNTHR